MYVLKDLPFPPSVNEYLAVYRNRLVKTDVHRKYLRNIDAYIIENLSLVEEMRTELQFLKASRLKQKTPFALKIECYYAINLKNINRSDASNRSKAQSDALSRILEIDDRYFFVDTSEKVTIDNQEIPCALVKITPYLPLTLNQVIMSINQVLISTNMASQKKIIKLSS